MPKNITLFIKVDASLGIMLKMDTSFHFLGFVYNFTKGMLLLKCHNHFQVLKDMIAFTTIIIVLKLAMS